VTVSVTHHHAEWIDLLETSGPFLTLPVLKRALPQGLDPVEPTIVDELRRAYEEWEQDPNLHRQWATWVLTSLLGFDEATLKEGPSIPSTMAVAIPEHDETLRPDVIVCDPSAGDGVHPRLLIQVWARGVALDRPTGDKKWSSSPQDRMAELLRGAGVRVGLVTNGERWVLADAPPGGPSAFVSWEAGVWLEERLTLASFVTLLGARRFFAVAQADTLEALLAESADAEHEVTDQLGRQVRQAVELLVDALSRADRERQGQLLRDLSPDDVYLAAVTVMMRLVFLLSAEERSLFLLGDPLYDSSYAVSTLRAQLQEEADRFGEEPLERRSFAWHRLLATFRMVHGGVEHENLRLPAYGSSLFDPDRFGFLEGRSADEPWTQHPGNPLPIDDRTVLHILDALQVLRFRVAGITEARRLSFRALDVEQIGHVYEGLLDHGAFRASDPAVGLQGKLEPEVALADLEDKSTGPRERFIEWLKDLTGRTTKSIEKALDSEPGSQLRSLLRVACNMDEDLVTRIEPYLGLLRTDLRGLPQVYLADSIYVTNVGERRSSGTYYTPRSLAEEVVRYTLEPLVYDPGPANTADASLWKLKAARDLLELRVCDMAMGSGAFLVAACRYLSDRLVEAWEQAGDIAQTIEGDRADAGDDELVVLTDAEDRLMLARRLVADRCLYGVDKNPMAVEMAKLSMWLITLAKDRPFSFLDHALRCGDSLLGIAGLTEIEHFHIDPDRGRRLHATLFGHAARLQDAVKTAIDHRQALESFTVLSLRDAEHKRELLGEATEALDELKKIADLVVGAAIATSKEGADALDNKLRGLAPEIAAAFDSQRSETDLRVRLDALGLDALYLMNTDRPPFHPDRRPFHWPIEFPEVFDRGGFDAIVGNPPFLGGKRITGSVGESVREYLVAHLARGRRGSADLVAYFFLRAANLTAPTGTVGLLATNTIAQGDTREVGLDQLIEEGWIIFRATKSAKWPGGANIQVSHLWLQKEWEGIRILDGAPVREITSALEPSSRVKGHPHKLKESSFQSFFGTVLSGAGFILSENEASDLIQKDPRNSEVILPYLSGDDLSNSPSQSPSRHVINFTGMSLEEAGAYPECLSIVRQRVKPHRDTVRRDAYRKRWWRFAEECTNLYKAIHELSRVLVIAQTSKLFQPAFVGKGFVYPMMVVVFAYEDDFHFGVFSSSFHWWWTLARASTLETRIRYTPTDCFETFAQPVVTDAVADAGKALDEHRRALMLDRQEGLTKTYNRVHDSAEVAADIVELRKLHVDLDGSVAAAYGWEDLELDHDFYETPQGSRYTLGPIVRTEILDRLLELNHQRFAEEIAAGQHPEQTGKSKKRNRRVVAEAQTSLEVD
jgi:hypothetical protein